MKTDNFHKLKKVTPDSIHPPNNMLDPSFPALIFLYIKMYREALRCVSGEMFECVAPYHLIQSNAKAIKGFFFSCHFNLGSRSKVMLETSILIYFIF